MEDIRFYQQQTELRDLWKLIVDGKPGGATWEDIVSSVETMNNVFGNIVWFGSDRYLKAVDQRKLVNPTDQHLCDAHTMMHLWTRQSDAYSKLRAPVYPPEATHIVIVPIVPLYGSESAYQWFPMLLALRATLSLLPSWVHVWVYLPPTVPDEARILDWFRRLAYIRAGTIVADVFDRVRFTRDWTTVVSDNTMPSHLVVLALHYQSLEKELYNVCTRRWSQLIDALYCISASMQYRRRLVPVTLYQPSSWPTYNSMRNIRAATSPVFTTDVPGLDRVYAAPRRRLFSSVLNLFSSKTVPASTEVDIADNTITWPLDCEAAVAIHRQPLTTLSYTCAHMSQRYFEPVQQLQAQMHIFAQTRANWVRFAPGCVHPYQRVPVGLVVAARRRVCGYCCFFLENDETTTEADTWILCPGCRTHWYCSAECQSSGSYVHITGQECELMRNLARSDVFKVLKDPSTAASEGVDVEYTLPWQYRLIARLLAVETMTTKYFGMSIVPWSELPLREQKYPRYIADTLLAVLPVQYHIALSHRHESNYRPPFSDIVAAVELFVEAALGFAQFREEIPYSVWMPDISNSLLLRTRHCAPELYWAFDETTRIPDAPGPEIPKEFIETLAGQYPSAPNPYLALRRDVYGAIVTRQEDVASLALETHGRWHALVRNANAFDPWHKIQETFIGRDDDQTSIRRLEMLIMFALESTGKFSSALTTAAAFSLLRYIVPRMHDIAVDKFDASRRKSREPADANDKDVVAVYLDSIGYFKAK